MPYWAVPDFACRSNLLDLLNLAADDGIDERHVNFCSGDWSRTILAKLVERAYKGQPLYEHLGSDTLKEHLLLRNIPEPPYRFEGKRRSAEARDVEWRSWQEECIALLDHADYERIFERFMDLPSELRELVYTLAIISPGDRTRRQQPAITRVSRRVRKESLPVFYKHHRFILCVKTTKDLPSVTW